MIGLIDPEVAAGVTRKLQQGRDDVAREHGVERAQLAIYLGDERLLQIDTHGLLVIYDGEVQPLVALGEHPGNELDQAIGVVVQVIEQAPPRDIIDTGRIELRTRRFEIERQAAIDEAR